MGEFLRCSYSFALLRSLAQLGARLLTIATTMRSGFFLSRLPSCCVRILGNVSTELPSLSMMFKAFQARGSLI